jgi:hypothetical protein
MTKTREQEAKEKKHLEDRLLVRTAKRFKRINFSRVENNPAAGVFPSRMDEYIINVRGFKEKLFLTENLENGSKQYSLWIVRPDGYLFETFEDKNELYAPVLKEMYENIKEKAIQYEEKQKKKKEKEAKRNERRYYRSI